MPTLLLLVTGCRQAEILESCPGSCTTIQGRLVTAGGSQGLAGATVTATWIGPGGGLGSVSHVKTHTTTDAAGNYRLTFLIKDDELSSGYFNLVFSVDQKRYYTIGEESLSFSSLKRDSTYQATPYLIPYKGSIDLKVTNPSQIVGTYWFDFSSAHGRYLTLAPRSVYGGGQVISVAQQPGSFSTTVDVAAEQRLYLRITKRMNNAPVRTVDSLVVSAGTTRPVVITF